MASLSDVEAASREFLRVLERMRGLRPEDAGYKSAEGAVFDAVDSLRRSSSAVALEDEGGESAGSALWSEPGQMFLTSVVFTSIGFVLARYVL
jgi:hypothetical protein